MADLKRIWIIGEGKPPFVFDAVLRESHTSELVTPENATETGTPITDGAYMRADRLEIEAGVSDVWLGMRDPQSQDFFAIQDFEEGDVLPGLKPDQAWLQGDGGGDAKTRSQRAFQMLDGLQRSAEPFDVQTGLKLYKQMVVSVLSTEQEGAASNVLYFRASLTEMVRSSTETVKYPPRAPGKTKRQASAKANNGEQPSKAVTDVSAALNTARALLGEQVGKATDTFKGFLPGGAGAGLGF